MKYILLLLVILTFIGCGKDEFFRFSIEQKKALLYYTYKENKMFSNTENETFQMMKNEIDTIDFTIEQLEIQTETERYIGRSVLHESYSFKAYSINENSITISADCGLDNLLYFKFIIDNNIEFNQMGKNYESINIDGETYYNVSQLINNDGFDTCYTSPIYGIIKAWNDSVVYRLVQ